MTDQAPEAAVPDGGAQVAWPNAGGFTFLATDDTPAYTDVLWLAPEEAEKLTQDDWDDAQTSSINAWPAWLRDRAQERYANWLDVMRPAEASARTLEAIDADIVAAEQQVRTAKRAVLDLYDERDAFIASRDTSTTSE